MTIDSDSYNEGGFLVPAYVRYEIMTSDYEPTKPSRWHFWRRPAYQRALAAWQRRFDEWSEAPATPDAVNSP